ncbi:MAG: RtcB family protein [Lachnospiraceae bacterium]|nr:RtcB family protein [Lachnospiraceae bacterium]
MIEIKGDYSCAKIFTAVNTDTAIEQHAVAQIKMLCDNPVSEGSMIRVMPDVHPGTVCTIGLTMTVGERIMPGLIGVDIGCGVSMVRLEKARMDYQKLDKVISAGIPAGMEIREKPLPAADGYDLSDLICISHVMRDRAILSLGTLGGGNHFIEADKDDEGNHYLAVHSGSRHLGKEVTEHYMRLGQEALKDKGEDVPYSLTYLEGRLMEEYLQDISIVTRYARKNRELILKEIMKGMKWKGGEILSVCHNYISEQDGGLILRKGAISACKDEPVIIPVNMKDGIILGKGLGNADWNCSAPHGAGRLMKREDVRQSHTVSEYRTSMKGVYSTCISRETLDEAPFAYRGMAEIVDAIKDTAEIDSMLTPLYSYKAGNGNDGRTR